MVEQPMTPPPPETAAVLHLLRTGTIDVQGQLLDASNATLFCEVTADGETTTCVYKPVAGERPLWDFPTGTLAAREAAAYVVSVATGWDLVPPTVVRDGPFGPGMVQLWIDTDDTVDLVALSRGEHPDLRRMAVLDAVINNADRKGSHLLPTADGRVRGVDHGVSFHVHDKLRTVLWRWRGEPLPDEAVAVLERLQADLAGRTGPLACDLAGLLDRREVAATSARVGRLLAAETYPQPSEDWPPVPWPPF